MTAVTGSGGWAAGEMTLWRGSGAADGSLRGTRHPSAPSSRPGGGLGGTTFCAEERDAPQSPVAARCDIAVGPDEVIWGRPTRLSTSWGPSRLAQLEVFDDTADRLSVCSLAIGTASTLNDVQGEHDEH